MAKHHNYLCSQVRKSAKVDREKYIMEICCDVENARMQNKTRAVYEEIRKVHHMHHRSEQSKIRWARYYQSPEK